jgi:ferredoxin
VRIIVDFDRCESNGMCQLEAPELFNVGDDDLLQILDENPSDEHRQRVESAASACPKQAITIEG